MSADTVELSSRERLTLERVAATGDTGCPALGVTSDVRRRLIELGLIVRDLTGRRPILVVTVLGREALADGGV